MFKPLSFIILLAASSPIHLRAEEPSYPKIFFESSWLYDSTVCPSDTHPVNQAWASELESRQGEFSKLWEADAPALFAQLFKDFGKGFTRKELTATLSACDLSWSYSAPLVLRVLPYLKSYRATYPNFPVFPDSSFSSLIFHELLHTWLVENFDFDKSSLIAKYRGKGETGSVLYHLHLMAIQKRVYSELGRADLLQFIDWNYSSMRDPAYPRAWEIVNKIEGDEPFITEIKTQLDLR